MSDPLVIYHGNCPDGFTAAWVVARALGNVELFAAKYGDEPPFDLAAERDVCIVDFSYPRLKLEQLRDTTRHLVVLDHHKTAQAELAGLDYCTFDMERSGAGLAWDHFHQGEARPWIVDYVEDRDLWRFKLPYSEELSLRIRLAPHELDAYDVLSSLPIESVYAEAAGAKLYLDHYVRDAQRNAYDLPALFEDETCRCVNVSYTGVSDVLHAALADGAVRVALAWHLGQDGFLNCSLRSTAPLDCSRFAKALGGGGHAQASGFRLAIDAPLAQRLLAAGAA